MLQAELEREQEDSPYKRKCRSWGFESLEEESRSCKEAEGDRTLELFPLHPEGRWRGLKKLLPFFFWFHCKLLWRCALFSFLFFLSFSSFFVFGKEERQSCLFVRYCLLLFLTCNQSAIFSLFIRRSIYLCAWWVLLWAFLLTTATCWIQAFRLKRGNLWTLKSTHLLLNPFLFILYVLKIDMSTILIAKQKISYISPSF